MLRPTLITKIESPRVSAASGLLLVDNKFYLIADDDLSLFIYPKKDPTAGASLKLFPGSLPKETKERKKSKPDLESLVHIPAGKLFQHGAILCVPSGSKKQRMRGALVRFNEFGFLEDEVQEINFTHLFERLEAKFADLNIEGAVLIGNILRLFQRGNGAKIQNATIDITIEDFLNKKSELHIIKEYELGDHNSVPFTFTDAVADKTGIWFLGVAEDTQDPYLDGAILGSILGRMNFEGKILSTHALAMNSKPEGICIDGPDFYMVTDDDDQNLPSKLYRGRLPI